MKKKEDRYYFAETIILQKDEKLSIFAGASLKDFEKFIKATEGKIYYAKEKK